MAAAGQATYRATSAKSVHEEPSVTLTEWLIVQAMDTGHLHFVGRKPDGKGRISSPIEEFDLPTMSGRTSSGRHYRLEGDKAKNHCSAAIVIAKSWGDHMVGRVCAVPLEEAVMLLPAKGSA